MDLSHNWQTCNTHTFWKEEASCSHVVQLYENDGELLNLLEDFVNVGIVAGDAVILIATAPHLAAIEQKLRSTGVDLEALKAKELYLPFIAEEVLGLFMVNGWPNYNLFMQTISGIFKRAKKENRYVRAFGEMVAILCAEGKSASTIMLEQLWNMYCEKEPFTLFCAYPKNLFPNDSDISLKNICKHHTKIITNKESLKGQLSYLNVT